nr:uncharacterized protein LOC106041623 [Anser cygnoides]
MHLGVFGVVVNVGGGVVHSHLGVRPKGRSKNYSQPEEKPRAVPVYPGEGEQAVTDGVCVVAKKAWRYSRIRVLPLQTGARSKKLGACSSSLQTPACVGSLSRSHPWSCTAHGRARRGGERAASCCCRWLADKGFLFTCLSPRPLPFPRCLDRWHRSGRRGGAGAAGWTCNSLLVSAGEQHFLSFSCALVVAPAWMQQRREPRRLCPCPGAASGALRSPRGLGRRMWLLLLSPLPSPPRHEPCRPSGSRPCLRVPGVLLLRGRGVFLLGAPSGRPAAGRAGEGWSPSLLSCRVSRGIGSASSHPAAWCAPASGRRLPGASLPGARASLCKASASACAFPGWDVRPGQLGAGPRRQRDSPGVLDQKSL